MDTIVFNLIEIPQQNNGEPAHEIVNQPGVIKNWRTEEDM